MQMLLCCSAGARSRLSATDAKGFIMSIRVRVSLKNYKTHHLQAEVYQMAYHVTVLNGLSDKEDNRFGAPILSNSPDWNGTYGAIGTTPVKSGRPTEKFP
jgi:hypothetical protein